MSKYKASHLILGMIFLLSVNSHANDQPELEEQGEVVSIKLSLMKVLAFAYDDFKKLNAVTPGNEEYFTVEILENENGFHVCFLPDSDYKIDGNKITITTGGANKYGRSVEYQFDKKGKLIKRWYGR